MPVREVGLLIRPGSMEVLVPVFLMSPVVSLVVEVVWIACEGESLQQTTLTFNNTEFKIQSGECTTMHPLRPEM